MSLAALPRPLLLGIVGVVLLGTVFFVTRKPSDTSSSTPVPSQTPAPANSTTPPGQTPAPAKPQTGPSGPGLPTRVKHALDARKVVVILFWNRRGVDDRSVKKSVDRLSHGRHVAVFSDSVRHLSHYTRITAAASVGTTPSLVIVNRKGQAEVVNGYVDRQTLGQYVRNALRR
jgi:hypothetical protein